MALYSKLSWGELKKNTERVESFLDKFDGKEDFILLDGKNERIQLDLKYCVVNIVE